MDCVFVFAVGVEGGGLVSMWMGIGNWDEELDGMGLTLEPFLFAVERERVGVLCVVYFWRVLISFQMTRAFYYPSTVTI